MKSLLYLFQLAGRKVRIYKGGPESKEGLLLHVKDDHLALLSNENEVIYYHTSHLKSVIEDTKTSNMPTEINENQQILEADSFDDLLALMVGNSIKIDRGGPNSLKGILLGMADDYLAIQTEKFGVIYFQTQHIKSISLDKESATNVQTNFEFPATTFSSLLSSFQHSWVSINRGPESVEGVLADMTNDYVTIIHHEKVHRLTNYHIRNICLGSLHDMKKQEDNQEKEQQNESNQDGNENEASSKEQENSNEKNEQEQKNDSSQKTDKNAKHEKESSKETEIKQEVIYSNSEEENHEKQEVETTNSPSNRSHVKKVVYDLIMKQVSMNIEEALNRAKNNQR